ncbi:MAG: protein phosphatase [Proteobacteria bacterium]|nr:protein phosphatase [Pseudomonadota bacterium]
MNTSNDISKKYNLPFKRSYWVVPGLFLAGAYPGSSNPEEARYKIKRLLDCGIRYIINLMEEDEVNYEGLPFVCYEEIICDITQKRNIDVYCNRYPTPDLGVPSVPIMEEIFDEIETAVEMKLPVYVHCWGGIGRTGTVVGCYLRHHGLATSKDVFDKIKALRKNDPSALRTSPETGIQRKMVRSWDQQFK